MFKINRTTLAAVGAALLFCSMQTAKAGDSFFPIKMKVESAKYSIKTSETGTNVGNITFTNNDTKKATVIGSTYSVIAKGTYTLTGDKSPNTFARLDIQSTDNKQPLAAAGLTINEAKKSWNISPLSAYDKFIISDTSMLSSTPYIHLK